jgi:ribonuclease P protein component
VDAKFLRDAAKSGASASPSRAEGASLRFPREARLVRRSEFDAVYRDARRRSGRHFTVFLRPNGLAHTRFGISVKRALGGSVLRNRIRRRAREIFRLHRREFPAGWDIVVHPRISVATAEFTALEAELLNLVRSICPPDKKGL